MTFNISLLSTTKNVNTCHNSQFKNWTFLTLKTSILPSFDLKTKIFTIFYLFLESFDLGNQISDRFCQILTIFQLKMESFDLKNQMFDRFCQILTFSAKFWPFSSSKWKVLTLKTKFLTIFDLIIKFMAIFLLKLEIYYLKNLHFVKFRPYNQVFDHISPNVDHFPSITGSFWP